MPQADYEVNVSIQKLTRVKDGAGGKTGTASTVQSGLRPTLHRYSYTNLFRHEQAPGGPASGPGIMTQNKVFFTFRDPFPSDVKTNYQVKLDEDFKLNGVVEWANGTVFNVLFVRRYARTMQVDAEIVV